MVTKLRDIFDDPCTHQVARHFRAETSSSHPTKVSSLQHDTRTMKQRFSSLDVKVCRHEMRDVI